MEGLHASRELIHRFNNAPVTMENALHWDLNRILSEIDEGLIRCAERTKEPIAAIGVDGWAVDYVRLNDDGLPIAQPFCYRDRGPRQWKAKLKQALSTEAFIHVERRQPLRINSLYQLMADQAAGVAAAARWVNLPEYVLARLGGTYCC